MQFQRSIQHATLGNLLISNDLFVIKGLGQ